MDKSLPDISPKKAILAMLLIGSILGLVVLFVSRFNYSPGWDFKHNLWAPAHLLVNSRSPYNIEDLFENGNAVWLPMAIGAFLPLGLLPLQQASNLWWFINCVGLIALVWLSSGSKRPQIILFTVILLMAFLFPPTISHFDLGQFTIIICLFFLIISTFEDRLHPFFLGLFFAVSLSKPQLTIFVLPGYFYAYFKRHGFSRTIQFFLLV